MRGRVEHRLVVPEDVLRAVAVVDVEIDDRDALCAVDGLRVAGGDGGIVEEAETHRRRRFGVMARRPRGDEGVFDLAGHHLVDREHRSPGGADRRLPGAGRHGGVLVDPDAPFLGRGLLDRRHVVGGMDAPQASSATRGA